MARPARNVWEGTSLPEFERGSLGFDWRAGWLAIRNLSDLIRTVFSCLLWRVSSAKCTQSGYGSLGRGLIRVVHRRSELLMVVGGTVESDSMYLRHMCGL